MNLTAKNKLFIVTRFVGGESMWEIAGWSHIKLPMIETVIREALELAGCEQRALTTVENAKENKDV